MASSASNDDDDDDDNDNATLDRFQPDEDDPPWFSLIADGTNEDELVHSLANVLEASVQIRKNRAYGSTEPSIGNAEDVAQKLINNSISRSEIEGARLWKVNRGLQLKEGIVDDAIEDACSNNVNIAIINSIAALGTETHTINKRTDRILDAGIEIYNVATETLITPDPEQSLTGLLESMDRAGIELQRKSARRDLVREAGEDAVKNHGRPGLGLVLNDDGDRVPGPDYDRVCIILKWVMLDDDHPNSISKRRAAKVIGCSRKTIYRALERPHLYRLDE